MTAGVPLSLGAEAVVSLLDWHGTKAVSKKRIPKAYRDAQLDLLLRSRRTRVEAELMHRAKLQGVDTPSIFFVDGAASELIMEHVSGPHLKDLTEGEGKAMLLSLYQKVGRYAAQLHSIGLMHGDLTTKNVLVGENRERVVLIDFGLAFISSRLEDRASDLHLLKQAIKSTASASKVAEYFQAALKGYSTICSEGTKLRELTAQIAKIEQRGRYARVD